MKSKRYNLPDGRLSFSGMTTFLACPRKYALQYMDKIERDQGDQTAMERGSLFHSFAEHDGAVSDEEVVETLEDPFQVARVKAAYKQYSDAERRGIFPKMKHKEVKLYSEEHQYLGYVDMIGVKNDGQWYLGELKTTGYLDPQKWSTMSINMQTALYSAMSVDFAHENFLLKTDFQGISFRSVVFAAKKPLKQNKRNKEDESPSDYATRIEGLAQVHHQIIKPADYQEHEVVQTFTYVKERIDSLCGNSSRAPRNTQSCFMYNRPCDFFKHCHGISPDLEDVEPGVESGVEYDV
jgi:PD-(D/E)XK nuclease superfamily protein